MSENKSNSATPTVGVPRLVRAKYFAVRGMDLIEIEADSVIVKTEDGQEIEIQFRRSDGEITLSAKKRLGIHPVAANCARVEDSSR